ncbi:MAG TPA: glycerophosphodiester phosphodiesterase [Gemmatimonadaceae bacterium]|nr:glycerophosphodiester phosphodiesterase [Gemmatimonadaceae bacterium]
MPRPEIVAHRGASREAPENTIAAFARALELGANGIELDVHKTADGAVVVHHDPVPKPCARAPDLAWRPISALTLKEMRRLTLPGGNAIPTLEEVLELVGSRLTVYCELKGAGVVEHALPLLAAHAGRCAVHAFDHRVVARAAELAPSVPRGILLVSRLVDTSHALRSAGASILWPERGFVDDELVQEVHGAGGQVIVWTANDPFDIARLVKLGVDAICTDDVGGARVAAASTLRPASA